MQNTNTIYSLSNIQDTTTTTTPQVRDSVCLLEPPVMADDSILICTQERQFMPQTYITSNANLWGSIIFTTVFLIIFAFIRLRGKDLLLLLLNTLVKRKKVEIILNEGITPNLVFYLLSLLLSFSIISVGVIYVGLEKFNPLYSLYIFGGLCIYHFFMLALVRVLGWTFNSKNTAIEVIVNLWMFHILQGLLIAPLIIAIFFVKTFTVLPLLKIAIICLMLLYLVKFIRWVEILFIHRVLILYMILYLCALEVMPLLVLYKLVS